MKNAIAMLLALVLCACASIKENPLTSQLVITQAVARHIESARAPAERAQRIDAIASSLLPMLQADAKTTVAALSDAVVARIDYASLSPADADAVDFLLAAIELEITRRTGAGLLKENDVVLIRDVIGWVLSVTSRYKNAAQLRVQ